MNNSNLSTQHSLGKLLVCLITLFCVLNSTAQDPMDDFDLNELLGEIDENLGGHSGGIDDLVTGDVTSFYYHPSTKLSLGKGIGNGNPVSFKKRCFDFETVFSQESVSAIETKFTRTEITSFSQLRKTLNFSGSISARLKFANKAGGDVGLSFAEGYTFSSDSLMIILKMEASYAQQEMDRITLRERYQTLIDDEEFDAFTRACGSHVVTSVDRKAMVFAVIRSDKMSLQAKEEIKASLGLKADLGMVSGEANISGEQVFEREERKGHLSISFHAIGGGGPQELGQLATAHSIEDIQATFKNYLEKFTNENVPAIVFNVTPMQDVLPEYAHSLTSEVRNINGALERLLDEFELINLELQRLKSGLVGGRLPDASKAHYVEMVKERLNRRKQLSDIAKKFLYQNDYVFANDPEYSDIIVSGELPNLTTIVWYVPRLTMNSAQVSLNCDAGKRCVVWPNGGLLGDSFTGSLWFSINMSPVRQLDSIELQAVFEDGRITTIPDSLRTREEIQQGSQQGLYRYRILNFSESQNLELYRRLRREQPVLSVKVVRADKTTQFFKLEGIGLEGNHY